MYLCHTLLRARRHAAGRRAATTSTSSSPPTRREVVVVVNQDYVTPADFVKAIDDAGLARYAFATLGAGAVADAAAMIDAGQRLVLLAENHAGAAPWYQLAYERLTAGDAVPLRQRGGAARPPAAPARPRNRGPAGAPLFLHQPLGHHRAGAAAQRRREGQRLRPAARPRAKACERIRAPPAEPARGQLLQGGRRLPGRRHAQPRAGSLGRGGADHARVG